MIVYPAIDIRGRRVVQLVGGDPDQVAVEEERRPGDQARHWRGEGARHVHVVDLDAALGGRRQWDQLGRIIAEGVKVQFGGGIRSMVDVQQLLDLGVDAVVVGTQGVRNPDWLRELSGLFPGKVVLAVDARGRDVVVEGWTESAGKDVVELASDLDDAGLGGFLYTNVEKEGRLDGIDAGIVRDLRDATPNTRLIVSGGITSMEDLHVLDGLAVDAVVLGMSIYTGRIDLAEAIRRFERHEPAGPAQATEGGR